MEKILCQKHIHLRGVYQAQRVIYIKMYIYVFFSLNPLINRSEHDKT